MSQARETEVMATGFKPAVHRWLHITEDVLDAHGTPRISGQAIASQNLYFRGFCISPTGMLREIVLEALKPSVMTSRSALDQPGLRGACAGGVNHFEGGTTLAASGSCM